MKVHKPLIFALVVVAISIPALAHPGPERHPIDQELDELASELRTEIDELETRLNERIDSLRSLMDEPNQEVIADTVESAIESAVDETNQSMDALRDRVEEIAASRGIPYWVLVISVLIGMATTLAFNEIRLRQVMKPNPKSSDREGETGETTRDKADEDEQEEEDQGDDRRIVTQTKKDPRDKSILALCHQGASWSPRQKADAIDDIRYRGIEYVAKGPSGNESEVEVVEIKGEPQLRTKPDKHTGNNLSELPDPS